jgi:hypothetical protein
VAPGLAMIAVTYGLARFAYGLFLPEIRESLDLSETALGYIGAGSYAGYCLAIVAALVFTSRTGPRFMAVAAGAVAVVGMAVVACAPAAWVLAVGIPVAGSSSGLASPPMGEAVVTSILEGLQDRANALINSGTIDKPILQHTATPINRHRRLWLRRTRGRAIGPAVSLWLSLVLTPLWHHRERNTVQHPAKLRRETGLDMRDLQTPANPCNDWIITRSWSRGKRFESARRLSFFLLICR